MIDSVNPWHAVTVASLAVILANRACHDEHVLIVIFWPKVTNLSNTLLEVKDNYPLVCWIIIHAIVPGHTCPWCSYDSALNQRSPGLNVLVSMTNITCNHHCIQYCRIAL